MDERRQRDLTHQQLSEQFSARFIDLRKHLDARLDTVDDRHDRMEAKQDDMSKTVTDVSIRLARIEGPPKGRAAADPAEWNQTPLWKRLATYATIGGAAIAILGGISAAADRVVIVAKAVGAAIVTHP